MARIPSRPHEHIVARPTGASAGVSLSNERFDAGFICRSRELLCDAHGQSVGYREYASWKHDVSFAARQCVEQTQGGAERARAVQTYYLLHTDHAELHFKMMSGMK